MSLVGAVSTRATSPEFEATLRARTGEVSAERTPLSGTQAARAISDAYRARFGEAPSQKMLAILGAQWSLETGGGRSMMNFNFGGIKGTGPGGLTVKYNTVEGSGPSEIKIKDRFRAYNNATEGAGDYLHVLEKRFPGALKMARAGDAQGFVHELKRAGYFTGSEQTYTGIVTDLAGRAEREGFDALGKSTGSTSSRAVPVHKDATGAPPAIDDLQIELLRMTHALDEAALGIMGAKEPRATNASDWMHDLRANLEHSRPGQ